ncbi:hypothetical protein M404DRAFT_1001768, partial [Pisolithus tinctorius Marx 270]
MINFSWNRQGGAGYDLMSPPGTRITGTFYIVPIMNDLYTYINNLVRLSAVLQRTYHFHHVQQD